MPQGVREMGKTFSKFLKNQTSTMEGFESLENMMFDTYRLKTVDYKFENGFIDVFFGVFKFIHVNDLEDEYKYLVWSSANYSYWKYGLGHIEVIQKHRLDQLYKNGVDEKLFKNICHLMEVVYLSLEKDRSFFNTLTVDEFKSLLKKCHLDDQLLHLFSSTVDLNEEAVVEPEVEEEEYKFDDMRPEYLALLNKKLPYVNNRKDFDGIVWATLSLSDAVSVKPCGKLDKAFFDNRKDLSDFYKNEFGNDVEMDWHLRHHITLEIMRAVGFQKIEEEYIELLRDLFIYPDKDQEEVIKNGFEKVLSKRERRVLSFFVRANRVVWRMVSVVAHVAKKKPQYGLLVMFLVRTTENVQQMKEINKIFKMIWRGK